MTVPCGWTPRLCFGNATATGGPRSSLLEISSPTSQRWPLDASTGAGLCTAIFKYTCLCPFMPSSIKELLRLESLWCSFWSLRILHSPYSWAMKKTSKLVRLPSRIIICSPTYSTNHTPNSNANVPEFYSDSSTGICWSTGNCRLMRRRRHSTLRFIGWFKRSGSVSCWFGSDWPWLCSH